ncbi:MAG: hypothetical protein QOG87_3452 [Actinomycetota bacterium]|jgi:AcrR family transcriptional regulator
MAVRQTRAEKKAETRERLLQAAEAIAAKQGLSRVTLDAVADGAGVTKGAIYSNFESKEDLILEVVSRMTPAMNLNTVIEGAPDVPTLLERVAAALTDVVRNSADQALLLVELDTLALRDRGMQDAIARHEPSDQDPERVRPWLEEHAAELPLPVEQWVEVVNAIGWGLTLQRMRFGPDRVPDELFRWAITRLALRPGD